MASLKEFFKSGHPPTLLSAFLYFDFSFAVWVLNGAMGPFISDQFHLTPAQIGMMVSIPALAALLAPRLAQHFGWQHVYGFAALMMLLPLVTMVFFAKEPPDIEHQSLRQHLSCLFERDGWAFNLIYVITFGGFLGLAT